jgi:HTH-type transcriptional regulator / antitoxin HigA
VSTTASTHEPTKPRPRLLRSESEHEEALAYVDTLMSAEPGTPEREELELWVHLVQVYEDEKYPIAPPDPLAAIRFRMEQQGLVPSDLVPYFGSKSRVSEVLSGKRTLSLAMIRRLHEGLGIPAEVLIAERAAPAPDSRLDDVDWSTFPLAEIAKRRWFGDLARSARELRENAEELLGGLILAAECACPGPVTLRQSQRANSPHSESTLRAWRAQVWRLAQDAAQDGSQDKHAPAEVDVALISEVSRLSLLEDGPLVARQLLAKAGVVVVVERQLPAMRLDGAAMRCADGQAIIGLTLRYDRLDHFWFTLCHELAHLALHLRGRDCRAVLDDLESEQRSEAEQEADNLAADALIPASRWAGFSDTPGPSEAELLTFARAVRVHPAVVAGRLRREREDYSKYGSLLGHGQVRATLAATRSAY